MTKTNSLKILLLSTLLVNTMYAKQTLCYIENLSSISEVETVSLNGGECNGTKTINDMKKDLWIVDDIKINTKDNKYSFTYIFKKEDKLKISSSLEAKVNKLIKQTKKITKETKILTKEEKLVLGEKSYVKNCLSCHGENAKKELVNAKALSKIFEFDYFQKMADYSVGSYPSYERKSPTAYIMEPISQFLKPDENDFIYLYIQTLKKK